MEKLTPCEICGGSCCKSIALPRQWFEGSIDWVKLHGSLEDDRVRFNQPCSKFCNGKCTIYAERPNACKTYPVGCDSCLRVIRIFVPEKEQEIREAINGR